MHAFYYKVGGSRPSVNQLFYLQFVFSQITFACIKCALKDISEAPSNCHLLTKPRYARVCQPCNLGEHIRRAPDYTTEQQNQSTGLPQVTAVTGRTMKYWHNKATTPTCRQDWSFPMSNSFPPSVVGWASLNTSNQSRALAVPIFVKMLSKEASFPDIPLHFSGLLYICPCGAVGCSTSETFSYRFPVKEQETTQ